MSSHPDLDWLIKVARSGKVVDRSYPEIPDLCKQMQDLPADTPITYITELYSGLNILYNHENNSLFERFHQLFQDPTWARKGSPRILDEDSEAPGPGPASNDVISLNKEPEIGEFDGSPVTRGGRTSPPTSPYDMPSPNPTAENWAENLFQELLTEEPVELAELLKGQDESMIASMFYQASILASDGKIKMSQNERGEVLVSKVITD